MKIEVPDNFLPLVAKALDHYYDYTRAVQREDSAYYEAAEFFREVQRKGPVREEGDVPVTKKKRA